MMDISTFSGIPYPAMYFAVTVDALERSACVSMPCLRTPVHTQCTRIPDAPLSDRWPGATMHLHACTHGAGRLKLPACAIAWCCRWSAAASAARQLCPGSASWCSWVAVAPAAALALPAAAAGQQWHQLPGTGTSSRCSWVAGGRL
jgi:hypothetical protein